MGKLIKLPGLIDPHVHLRDLGQEHKEDFFTGTSAALAGGYTTIFDMPNNTELIDSKKLLARKIAIAKEKIVCDVGFYFGSLGSNLNEFKDVKNHVFGLKLYLNLTTGKYITQKNRIKIIFEKWPSDKLILVHAENEIVSFVLKFVRKTGKRVHFCHVSAEELKFIIKAKKQNLPVSCGVSPHHLFITRDMGQKLGSLALMKPGLKSAKDVEYLWKNLNMIDVVESDHAPHSLEEKNSDDPPFGVPGLETTLPLLLTAVSQKRITMEDVIRLCYDGPRKLLNLRVDKNSYSLIDLSRNYVIKNENLVSKAKWTPFHDWQVKGKVNEVFVRGKRVFSNGKVVVKPGWGRVIIPF